MIEQGIVSRVNGTQIKVRVPSVLGRNESTWAEPVGSGLPPAINDKVWVDFVHGDVSRPVYYPTLTGERLLVEDTTIATNPSSGSTLTDTGLSVVTTLKPNIVYKLGYKVKFSTTGGTSPVYVLGTTTTFDNSAFPLGNIGESGYTAGVTGSAAGVVIAVAEYFTVGSYDEDRVIKVRFNGLGGQTTTLTPIYGWLRLWQRI